MAVRSEDAEAALRALAEAMSIEPSYPIAKETNGFVNTASGQAIEAAVRRLKEVFGPQITLYFNEPDKRLHRDLGSEFIDPPPSRGFARVQIEKVKFVDRNGRRSGLNLDGLRAPLLLRLWNCDLWYLLLYNADLFALDLRDLRSDLPAQEKDPDFPGWTHGVWFAAIGMKASAYVDIDNCHFSVFIVPGLETRRLRIEKTVRVDLGKQVAQRFLPALGELAKRLHTPKTESVPYTHADRIDHLAAIKAALGELAGFRLVVDISYCKIAELYFSAQCDSCANFKGTEVSGSFEIDGASFVDPLFKRRTAGSTLFNPISFLDAYKDVEPIKNFVSWIDDHMALPVIDFSDLRVQGRLALLNLGRLSLANQPESAVDRVVGLVDFSSAKCTTFADDETWWASRDTPPTWFRERVRDESLCYNLSYFDYQFIDVVPRPTRDPFFDGASPMPQTVDTEASDGNDIAERKAEWLNGAFVGKKDAEFRFDAQPWSQCASALRRAGRVDAADRVLFYREDRLRNLPNSPPESALFRGWYWLPSILLGLSLLSSAIAGLHYFSFQISFWDYVGAHLFAWPLGTLTCASWIYCLLLIALDLARWMGIYRNRGTYFYGELFTGLLSLTVGYGFRPQWALICAISVVFAGAGVYSLAEYGEPKLLQEVPSAERAFTQDRWEKPASDTAGQSNVDARRTFPKSGASTSIRSAESDPGRQYADVVAPTKQGCVIGGRERDDDLACDIRDGVWEAMNQHSTRTVATQFNPLMFSLDVFVPLDFGQGGLRVPVRYLMQPNEGESGDRSLNAAMLVWSNSAFLLWCFYWFQIASGWWLTIVLGAYLSGLLERKF